MQPGASQASRRRHFRLRTLLAPCVLVMGEDPPCRGQAADIGGGGLLFIGRGDAPEAAIGATGSVEFALVGEQFSFPVLLVRRVDTAGRRELALAWPEASPREVDRLMYCLYKIETSRRGVLPAGRATARPAASEPPARRRDWLLVAALGVAGGALLPTRPLVPTFIVAALLAIWLVTSPS